MTDEEEMEFRVWRTMAVEKHSKLKYDVSWSVQAGEDCLAEFKQRMLNLQKRKDKFNFDVL